MFPRPGGRQACATPEQLTERYDRLDIEKGVLLSGDEKADEETHGGQWELAAREGQL